MTVLALEIWLESELLLWPLLWLLLLLLPAEEGRAGGSGEERAEDVDVRPRPSFGECVASETSTEISCGEEAEPAILRFLVEAVVNTAAACLELRELRGAGREVAGGGSMGEGGRISGGSRPEVSSERTTRDCSR